MLYRLIGLLKGVIAKMLGRNEIQRALQVETAVSNEMQTALMLWADLFQDKAPWRNRETQSYGLAASIAGEIARLVTVEFQSKITGSTRAEYLDRAYQAFLPRLRPAVEYAAAAGTLIFKPYLTADGQLAVDCVPAWRFVPTAYNSLGQITGAAFIEQVQRGNTWYHRIEHHQLTDKAYTIHNAAYKAFSASDLGTPCALQAVPEWAALASEVTIRNQDGSTLARPLFAVLRMPMANTIDADSPLGVSVYSRAIGLIEQADRQYSRILWEYEGSELAIDATDGALPPDDRLPQRQQRLFRQLGIEGKAQSDLYEVFSPQIRDTALFHGLDKLLKRIEFNCYLSYGTLSDPQNVDKTAEEIRSSKQRSYSTVRDIQKALEHALDHLIWVMDQYASLYHTAPSGAYKVSYSFGDGVLEDTDKEFAQRMQLVNAQILRPELMLTWYYGCSEEEARKMLPQQDNPLSAFLTGDS